MEIEEKSIHLITYYKETDPDLLIEASYDDMVHKNKYKKIKKVFLCFKDRKEGMQTKGIKECFLFDAEKALFKKYFVIRFRASAWFIKQRKVTTSCIDLEPWQIDRFEQFFELISKDWNKKTISQRTYGECELVVVYKDDTQWSFSWDVDEPPYNLSELVGLFITLEINDSLVKGEKIFCRDCFHLWEYPTDY